MNTIEVLPISDYGNTKKVETLLSLYKKDFPASQSAHISGDSSRTMYFARAPGRVNLIGEHIDYSGFSVLPMAIEQDMAMLFTYEQNQTNDSYVGPLIELRNVDSVNYADFALNSIQQISDVMATLKVKVQWHHYFLCGVFAIKEYAEQHDLAFPNFAALRIAAYGSIPPNAGLSSSSALVVCAAMVIAKASRIEISRDELAQACMRSECHVGTMGGGMDQAISVLAPGGGHAALHIQFTRPRLTLNAVRLPAAAHFVVLNSADEENKAASNAFNTRVIESRLAAHVLVALGWRAKLATTTTTQTGGGEEAAQPADWRKFAKLSEAQRELGLDTRGMLQLIDRVLSKEAYATREIADLLDIPETELVAQHLSKNTQHIKQFNLRSRAQFVFEEVDRVREFIELCDGAAEKSDNEAVLRNLGDVLNRGHYGCELLYRCTSARLDRLVHICQSTPGCYGCRMTGAGWGGCAVALVSEQSVTEFKRHVAQAFYVEELGMTQPPFNVEATHLVFSSSPAAPANLFRLLM